MQKTEARPLSFTLYKSELQTDQDLNVRPEILKPLQENVVETLKDAGIGNYWTRTPITQEIRARIAKWYCIKLKSFCTTKETITRIKRQPTEWEKILASYSTDKDLRFRIYKEHKNYKRTNNK
jgi:hypothetical protein